MLKMIFAISLLAACNAVIARPVPSCVWDGAGQPPVNSPAAYAPQCQQKH